MCAADLEYLIHAGHLCRRQNDRIDLTLGVGGRHHHQLLDTGDFGGDGVHQHRGGVSGSAAGDVKTGPIHGDDFLAHEDAVLVVDDEAVAHLMGVELANIGGGFFQNLNEAGIHSGHRFIDFFRCDLQGGELGFVKLFAVFKQGLVAVLTNICNNICHNIRDIEGRLHPGENLVGADLAVFHDLDHLLSSSWARMLETMPSICAPLNL